MKTTILASSLVSASLLAPAALAAPVDQRIDKLEQEIAALKQQQSKASSGNTNITMGGYIKLDASLSDYSEGFGAAEDFLIASTIPTKTNGKSGDINTHFHAKESRLWIKSETNTDAGVIKSHLEIDFIGSAQGNEVVSNSYSPRLRHAYFSWNNWLVGQTWSTFFNVGTLPELLDFVGPIGTIFIRQAQIRYTSGPMQIAVENPSTMLYGAATSPYDDNQMPDLIGRYNFELGPAKMSASAMVRELAYENTTSGDSESEIGYAISLAGKIPFDNGDDIRFMVNAGDALGRYMGLSSYRSGVIEGNGDIELIDQVGFFAAYRHLWNSQWRSNFSISASEADNPTSAGTDVPESYQSVHANLIYKPTSALDFGAEIIHATKELASGADGSMNRLQFSAKYVY